jgi:hypothetical protein
MPQCATPTKENKRKSQQSGFKKYPVMALNRLKKQSKRRAKKVVF